MKKKVFNVVLSFLIVFLVFVISMNCFDVDLYELFSNENVEIICISYFSVCTWWFIESILDLVFYFFENIKKKTQE